MAVGFLATWLGRADRLPRDQVSRLPRAAKKAASGAISAMNETLTKLSALPGIADVKDHHRVPRGFYGLMTDLLKAVDDYHGTVRKFLPLPEDSRRPGEPGGTGACYAAPMGVSGVEALNIYRAIRGWRDLPRVAQRMAELGEEQFKAIQSGHSGKDPEKIRAGGKAVRQGRLAFARAMHPCPFLDEDKQRCRVWNERPLVCRMHHPTTPAQWSFPSDEHYPRAVKAKNIRLPIKTQVSLSQLDKRMMLQVSPLLYAGILQLLQLSDGQMIQELGEAPLRVQQDGQVAQRANRNVKHAAKFKKKKKKKRA